VVGSPFGFLSPNSFQNSISKGIVGNVLGKTRKNIMITDARMLPGSEGGGIFNTKGQLVGLCTLPLRRIDTEVELNIGVCLDALIDDLEDIIGSKTLVIKQPSGMDDIFVKAKKSLCLVHVAYSWASGILISHDGYVLTNAHLFEPHLKNKKLPEGSIINIQLDVSLTEYHRASLVWVSTGPLDLAIVKLDNKKGLSHVKLQKPPGITQGQKIFVVGYPLYNPNIGMTATITSGVISKIVRLGGIPAMIQSSALVHRGNSGGMLINGNGEFLGIITSNVKHHMTNTEGMDQIVLIPGMNFTIPIERLLTIDKAIHQDLTLLKEYDVPNKKIKDIWDFKDDSQEKQNKFTEFLDKMESLKQSKL
jgi:S1-C subfamily serine protease